AVQCVLLKFVQGLQRRQLVVEYKRLVFQGLGQLEWLRQLRQQGKQALDDCGSNSASCETGAEIKQHRGPGVSRERPGPAEHYRAALYGVNFRITGAPYGP